MLTSYPQLLPGWTAAANGGFASKSKSERAHGRIGLETDISAHLGGLAAGRNGIGIGIVITPVRPYLGVGAPRKAALVAMI